MVFVRDERRLPYARTLIVIHSRLNNVIFRDSNIDEEKAPASTAVSNSLTSFA
jgi:hypothetical protein